MELISRMRSTVYIGVIGVVAHVPSIFHLSQVGGCGQVLLLMCRIIECWISVRYFFPLFYQTRCVLLQCSLFVSYCSFM